MRNSCAGLVLAALCMPLMAATATKSHVVTLGVVRKVPYQSSGVTTTASGDDAPTLKIRALLIDGVQKEWTTGEAHDVTDRSFTVQRVMKLNDALAGEAAHWVWQPGPWLLVDRATGRVTALHLPDFDPVVSQAVWFRDYAAYCGVNETVRAQSLVAVVAQLGVRRPVVHRVLSKWDAGNHATPACAQAVWMRTPMRVKMQPTGGDAFEVAVEGNAAGLIEDNDDNTPQP